MSVFCSFKKTLGALRDQCLVVSSLENVRVSDGFLKHPSVPV